jgi:hypothetical protein
MKATLEFTLPLESEAHKAAVNGPALRCMMSELYTWAYGESELATRSEDYRDAMADVVAWVEGALCECDELVTVGANEADA